MNHKIVNSIDIKYTGYIGISLKVDNKSVWNLHAAKLLNNNDVYNYIIAFDKISKVKRGMHAQQSNSSMKNNILNSISRMKKPLQHFQIHHKTGELQL